MPRNVAILRCRILLSNPSSLALSPSSPSACGLSAWPTQAEPKIALTLIQHQHHQSPPTNPPPALPFTASLQHGHSMSPAKGKEARRHKNTRTHTHTHAHAHAYTHTDTHTWTRTLAGSPWTSHERPAPLLTGRPPIGAGWARDGAGHSRRSARSDPLPWRSRGCRRTRADRRWARCVGRAWRILQNRRPTRPHRPQCCWRSPADPPRTCSWPSCSTPRRTAMRKMEQASGGERTALP